MRLVSQLLQRLRQKGLRRALRPLWQRHVFQHWQLVWLDRDPLARVPRQRTRPCPPVRLVQITPSNTDAFARHFPGQLQAMNDLAREGHTGHMYLDEAGDAVAMVWASTRDYHDRHYYGCTFPVQPGEYFQFAGEVDFVLAVGAKRDFNVLDSPRVFPQVAIADDLGKHGHGIIAVFPHAHVSQQDKSVWLIVVDDLARGECRFKL